MQCQLDSLDLRGLVLALAPDRRVELASLEGLRGTFVQEEQRREVTGLQLARGELRTFALRFGAVEILGEAATVFEDLRGELREDGGEVSAQLTGAAVGHRLRLQVGELELSGRLELRGVRLRIDGDDGVVVAEHAVCSELELVIAGTRAEVARLEARHLVVAWGEEGLRVEIDELELASGRVAIDFPRRSEPAQPAKAPLDPAIIGDAMRLLDGLSGDVNVDLGLDLTVPVLGRRRATHRFRIPISGGTIDYMALENDLSTLENALLDFSMRDRVLVLEMGIPFVPTRGLGKPIVAWELDGADVDLARLRRIRLARLPEFRLASEGSDKPSRIALRQLALRDLDARLRLELADPPPGLPLHRLGLDIAGELSHEPDAAPRPGKLRVRATELELGALARQVAGQRIAIERAGLASAEAEVTSIGATPETADVQLHAFQIKKLSLGPAHG
jgi:hypothetical protein